MKESDWQSELTARTTGSVMLDRDSIHQLVHGDGYGLDDEELETQKKAKTDGDYKPPSFLPGYKQPEEKDEF